MYLVYIKFGIIVCSTEFTELKKQNSLEYCRFKKLLFDRKCYTGKGY